ncbi:MAG TPA: hypothetical protein VHK69_03955, partial [Chitinophagaceae bacterium]|nr:hypothetical protein [Chitinophagaceae bacterium]
MKFAKGKGSDFYTGLNIRINQYFRQTGRDRFGSRALYGKGAVLLLAYAGCYACLFLFAGRYAVLVPACIGLGLSGVMIVFNLVHDAAHGAVSSSKRINTALTTLGDLVGINTYI